MKKFKSVINFLLLLLAILAFFGGTAYLFYFRLYLFGVANLALGYLSWPSIKEIFKDLKG